MTDRLHQHLPFADTGDGYIQGICPSCGSSEIRMEVVQMERGRQTRVDVATEQVTTTPPGLMRYPSVSIEWGCVRGHVFTLTFLSWGGADAFRGVTIHTSPEGVSPKKALQ